MIRLRGRAAREPRTVEIGWGASVTFKPLTFAAYEAAKQEARDQAHAVAEADGLIREVGGTIHDIPDRSLRAGLIGLTEQLILQACAKQQVIGWSGIGNADGTADAECTPEAVAELICYDPLVAERLRVELLGPIFDRAAEGNASPAAPAGTGAAAANTADSATNSAPPAPAAG